MTNYFDQMLAAYNLTHWRPKDPNSSFDWVRSDGVEVDYWAAYLEDTSLTWPQCLKNYDTQHPMEIP